MDGLNDKDKSLETFINIMLSTNIPDAKKSLEHHVVPAFNILLANKKLLKLLV